MAETEEKGERIAKRIARAGVCSRRDAERLIEEGKVMLDGKVLTSPAVLVNELSVIKVNGKPLPAAEETKLWRYHKPKGVVTTHKDPQGRPTLFDRLPAGLPRVISIGRLDLNSEGLLLLTNDGALARRLELPSTGWLRRYRVRVHGVIDPKRLEALANGVTIEGVQYGAVEAKLDSTKGANSWLTMSLREGKNREIRKIVEHLGADVNRLIRLAYGPFQLGYLEPGQVEEVRGNVLRDQVGTGEPKKRPKKTRSGQKANAPGPDAGKPSE